MLHALKYIPIAMIIGILTIGYINKTEAVPITITHTYDPTDILLTRGVFVTYTHDVGATANSPGIIPWATDSPGYILDYKIEQMFVDDGDEDYIHQHTTSSVHRHESDCGGPLPPFLDPRDCDYDHIHYTTITHPPHYEFVAFSYARTIGAITDGKQISKSVDAADVGGIFTENQFWQGFPGGWNGEIRLGVEGVTGDVYFAWSKLTVTYDPEKRNLEQDPPTNPPKNPVPEPTTIALLGIGLVGIAGTEVRRRRKKKAVDNS